MSELKKKIQRMIDRNKHNVIEIVSYFNEQSMEDWFIKDKPKNMFIEGSDLTHDGMILTFYFDNAAISFSEKDYLFHADEFKNYISAGSRKHKDHYIIIEFQR